MIDYSYPAFLLICSHFPLPPKSLSQSAPNYLSPQVLNLCSFVCLLPFPTYLTPHAPLVTAILFFISKFLVLFCSFVWWIRFLTLNVKLLSYQVLTKFPRKLSSHLTDLHLNFFVLVGTFARKKWSKNHTAIKATCLQC